MTHHKVAVKLERRIDREGILLLEDSEVLPLDRRKAKRISVLGPMAHRFMNVCFCFLLPYPGLEPAGYLP